MADFKKDALVPSLFHGAAATPAFQQSIADAVSAFVANKNVDVFVKAVDTAAKDSVSN
jgi:glucose/mannose transport system substrate-binding protein